MKERLEGVTVIIACLPLFDLLEVHKTDKLHGDLESLYSKPVTDC